MHDNTMDKVIETKSDAITLARACLQDEIQALKDVSARIDSSFDKACELLLHCKGRVVVIGMGKSGHIGCKIAATFASTGTPSFFVHPAEANHGDIGMLTSTDIILAISYSGETSELLNLLPSIQKIGAKIVSITGNIHSTLSKMSSVTLNVHVTREACPLGLAPTSSTTATLALGDALAVALLKIRGFTPDQFAFYHPGGSLGKKLLLQVKDIMHSGNRIPSVHPTETIAQTLCEMTEKSLGMTTVVDPVTCELLGIFTDGDLRRTLDSNIDIQNTPIKKVMSINCRTIKPSTLASDAIQLMKNNKITSLIVMNTNIPIGVVHLHTLLQAGVS